MADAVVWSLATNISEDIFAIAYVEGSTSVYRSTDNGITWNPTGLTNIDATSIIIYLCEDIFVGTAYDGGIFRSTDDGVTWIQTGLSSSYFIGTFAINSAEHIFAGTSKGVYRSTDSGETWSQINAGLTTKSVPCLAVNSKGYIFAGTNGGGVFRSNESTTLGKPPDSFIPSNFILEQNFPNPFNLKTKIRFQLPITNHVKLKIFNILGEEIGTLTEAQLDAGLHCVRWDGKDKNGNLVASGVYLYKLQMGTFSEVRKMILQR